MQANQVSRYLQDLVTGLATSVSPQRDGAL